MRFEAFLHIATVFSFYGRHQICLRATENLMSTRYRKIMAKNLFVLLLLLFLLILTKFVQ